MHKNDSSDQIDFTQGVESKYIENNYIDLVIGSVHPLELNSRNGINNTFLKLKNDEHVTIAYIGGSITVQEGWRPRTTAWFKQHFPQSTIFEINAALSGTGSDLAVARFDEDVLSIGTPDLLFIEFNVNDNATKERIIQSLEGIILKLKDKNPYADICFVYTLSHTMLNHYQSQTSIPKNACIHEMVANHYELPSIHFGYAVAELVLENKLIFKGDDPSNSCFSKDGIHPTPFGDELYGAIMRRCLKKMSTLVKDHFEKVRAKYPLTQNHYKQIKMIDAALLEHVHAKRLDKEDIIEKYKTLFKQGFIILESPQDTIRFQFNGTIFGIFDVGGPESGQLSITIDENEPITINRFTQFNDHLRHQYFFLDTLEDKKHVVLIQLSQERPNKRQILNKKEDYDQFPDKYKDCVAYIGKIIYR